MAARDTKHVEILMIEDSPTAAQLAEAWLDEGLKTPFTLTAVSDLRDGVAHLSSASPDIIVLDLNLPDSEGLDTFRQVKNVGDHIPIVILSSETDEQFAVEAVREGAQDYVVKGNHLTNPLARPVRFAIERVRRQRAEQALEHSAQQMRVASVVQQQLFPVGDVGLDGFDIRGQCIPADSVAGDYFDFFPIVGDDLGLAIGDVVGHGIGSALRMVETRAVLRALATTYGDVGHMLTLANSVMLSDRRFVSLFLARLNPVSHTLNYACGGHPALVLRKDGSIKRHLESDNPPLGIIPDATFKTWITDPLEPGEILILYTDGINETQAPAGDYFGTGRIVDTVAENRHLPAGRIIDAVFAAVKSFSEDQPQLDDMTLVVAKAL